MTDILDKVLDGITNGAKALSDGLTYFLKKTRIKRQIKDAQFKKMQMLRNLGELVYNLQVNGDISVEESIPMCTKITEYNEKIKQLQTQSKEIDETKSVIEQAEIPQIEEPDMAVCTDKEDETDPASAEL